MTHTMKHTDPASAVAALLELVTRYAFPNLYVLSTMTITSNMGTEPERAQRVLDFAGETGATVRETGDQLSATLAIGDGLHVFAQLTVATPIEAPEVATRYAPRPTVADALEQAFGPMQPEPDPCAGGRCSDPVAHAEGGHDR